MKRILVVLSCAGALAACSNHPSGILPTGSQQQFATGGFPAPPAIDAAFVRNAGRISAPNVPLPVGIAPGPDGDPWFVEQATNKIGRITPGGAVTEFAIPTAASSASVITMGPDGNLWFSEIIGNKIARMTP